MTEATGDNVAVAIIVIDTNILVASPRLQSREWMSLIENAADWGIRIVVPDVVVMETVNVVRRRWASKRQKVADLELDEFELGAAQTAMVTEIDKRCAEYEEWLRRHLDEIGAEIATTPQISHMDIASRASEGRAPYCKDKDGYRDTLVWYTVLATAQQNPGTEIWFVSDNHTDFGPKPGDWTGPGAGKRDDCPILFHIDLIAELADKGLDERVFYVVSVNRLEQHFAARFAPINESDLAQLVEGIDSDELAKKLVDVLVGFALDPEEAALPLQVLAAEIVGSREQLDGWTFSEGAGRGEAGWTARFAVDTEVDIAMAGELMSSNEDTKVLRLAGEITVSPNGDIVDMAVNSAEALPGDPMRARWMRRAGRDAETLEETYARLKAIDFLASQNRDLARTLAAFQTPGIADYLKTQNAELVKTFQQVFQTPGIADYLKTQNAELVKTFQQVFQTPGIADYLKTQNAELVKTFQQVFQTPGIADYLKTQNAELVKTFQQVFQTPGIADYLKTQNAELVKTFQQVFQTPGIAELVKAQDSSRLGPTVQNPPEPTSIDTEAPDQTPGGKAPGDGSSPTETDD